MSRRLGRRKSFVDLVRNLLALTERRIAYEPLPFFELTPLERRVFFSGGAVSYGWSFDPQPTSATDYTDSTSGTWSGGSSSTPLTAYDNGTLTSLNWYVPGTTHLNQYYGTMTSGGTAMVSVTNLPSDPADVNFSFDIGFLNATPGTSITIQVLMNGLAGATQTFVVPSSGGYQIDGSGGNDFVHHFTEHFPNTSPNVPFTIIVTGGSWLLDVPTFWFIPVESDCTCKSSNGGTGTYSSTGGGIDSSGFGSTLAPSISITNNGYGTYGGGIEGNNSFDTNSPSLVQSGPYTVTALDSGSSSRWFDFAGNGTNATWVGRYGINDSLTKIDNTNSATYEYIITDTGGNQTHYYDFNSHVAAGLRGKIKSVADAEGNLITYSYNASNQMTAISRVYMNGTNSAVGEKFTYNYFSSGSTNLVSSVILSRAVNSSGTTLSSYVAFREQDFSYYDGSLSGAMAYGNANDLRTVALSDSSNQESITLTHSGNTATATVTAHGYSTGDTIVISGVSGASDTAYNGTFIITKTSDNTFTYTMAGTPADNNLSGNAIKPYDVTYDRYYTSGGGSGYQGALKFSLGPASYARLATGSGNPFTAVDGTVTNLASVAPYADTYYEYDSNHHISKRIVQGEGCSSCSGGQGAYTESYTYNRGNATNGPNTWHTRTIEVLPDGNQTVSYYDIDNQLMLAVSQDLGAALTISAITHGGASGKTITVTTSSNHGYSNNDVVVIRGASIAAYNGIFKITYVNATQFTYTLSANPGSDPSQTGVTSSKVLRQVGTYTQYDSSGRAIEVAQPSAVNLPANVTDLEAKEDLSQWPDTTPLIRSTTGLIDVYDYTTNSTTADISTNSTTAGLTAGDVVGYLQDHAIKRGSTGSSILIESWTYVGHTYQPSTNVAAVNVYETATDTRYGDTGGGNPRVTSYSYGFRADGSGNYFTPMVLFQTTSLPPIIKGASFASGQNGPADSTSDTVTAHLDISTVYFDAYGRTQWTKDGDGYIDYIAYDQATGAVVETIVDVNTTNTTNFANLPAGWTSTNHTALHLIASSTVDGAGRTTLYTDPRLNLTVMTYNDVNHETRAYRGYMSGTNFVEVGPTQVQREDRAGSYDESLTLVAIPTLDSTSGLPVGTESITAGGIRMLSRTHVTPGGQVDESDRYFTLTSGTNSAVYAQGAGTFQLVNSGTTNVASADFYATTYGYDDRGREDMVKNTVGTITRMIYDYLGRATTIYVGTNDQPGTNDVEWTPTNQGTSSNMIAIRDNYYDTYDPQTFGVGDGNLTRSVLHPNGTNGLRVTENFYDWRDRLDASKIGLILDSSNRYAKPSDETGQSGTNNVHRPIIYYTYDNLDEVTQVQQYDGDGYSPSGTNGVVVDANADGVPDAPDSSTLRSQTSIEYDDQGRVYRTSVYSVDSSGNVGSYTLDTNTWYDHRGNAVATQQPGGLVSKVVIDGAGRTIRQYTTDGAVLNNPSNWSNWTNATTLSSSTSTGDLVLSQSEITYDENGNVIYITTRDRFHNDATNGGGLGSLQDPSNNPKARAIYQAFWYDAADRQTDAVDVGTNTGTNGVVTPYTRWSSPPTNSTDTLHLTHTTYNDSGWVDVVTDPRAINSKTVYDMLGRVARSVAAWVDPGTNTLNTFSDHNQITDFTYDGSDHLLTQKAWVNNNGTNNVFQTTGYVYGVTTSTSNINSNDLLAQVQYPDKTTGSPNSGTAYAEVYTYDAIGEMTKKTQRTGSVHQYSHDSLGRMTSDNVITLGSGVASNIRRQDYAFDGAGRLYQSTSFSNTSGATVVNQIQRDYNGLGQITREWQAHSGTVVTSAGTNQTTSVQYTYSEMAGGANHSRLTGIVYPDGSRTVGYDYSGTSNADAGLDDVISRLSALTMGTNVLESYDYLGLSTVIKKAHPQTGFDLTYIKNANDTLAGNDGGDQYSGIDRFDRIADQWWMKDNGGTNIATTNDRFQYGYDRNSNVMFKLNLGPGTSAASFSELYHANGSNGAYDNLNRLTDFRRGVLSKSGGSSVYDTITTSTGTRNWTLDAQGNWSQNASGDNYATNSQNQYTTLSSGTNSLSYSYDNDGNMKTRVDHSGLGCGSYVADTFTYDAWDRMASFTHTVSPGNTITETDFNYDGLGRRNKVTVTQGCLAQPADELYYSTDWQVLEDDRTISGTTTKNQYVWSPTYVNGLVLRDRDINHNGNFDERIYVMQDANHNVTGIISATNGAVLERFIYDPYGVATVKSSTWGTASDSYLWQYMYQGGRYDSTTGLYNFQRREYDPNMGRWITQDPASVGTNLYQFVDSNPINQDDPLGLDPASRPATTQAGGDPEGFHASQAKNIPFYSYDDLGVDTYGATIAHVTLTFRVRCDEALYKKGQKAYFVDYLSMDVDFAILISLANIGKGTENGDYKPKYEDVLPNTNLWRVAAGTYGHEQEHVIRIRAAMAKKLSDLRATGTGPYESKRDASMAGFANKDSLRMQLLTLLSAAGAHDDPHDRKATFLKDSTLPPVDGVMPKEPAGSLPKWATNILNIAGKGADIEGGALDQIGKHKELMAARVDVVEK